MMAKNYEMSFKEKGILYHYNEWYYFNKKRRECANFGLCDHSLKCNT
jgi:hypothetical protein